MELTERNLPSFFRFPYHTDRTAWRDFGLPMILVVPHVRDVVGTPIGSSGVKSVSISIADAGTSPVAGHDHIGIFNPAYDLYNITISETELNLRRVSQQDIIYLDAAGDVVTSANATKIKFTCRASIIGEIDYLPHADYIDISDIKLEVEQLDPKKYVLTYGASYYRRRISDNDELLCIEDNIVLASYSFLVNHPGDVLLMMFRSTPSQYFNQAKLSEDSTISFYRPFSDILQDAHDEQNLQKKANWVYDIVPEHVPYLGFMLGWELPYFPQSVDSLRRAVLRNMVKLQRLKGSKRAVRELFDLFGFAVDIANVWWTPGGERFASPGEQLPPSASDYEIGLDKIVTTEPLLMEFTEDGFGHTTAPLIHNVVDRSVTVRAYVARRNSDAHDYLAQVGGILSTDFDALDYPAPTTWQTLPSSISQVETKSGLLGATTALLDHNGNVASITATGDAPIQQHGLKHDYISNVMDIQLSRYYQFDTDDTVLYIFATYVYDKIVVPTSMSDLQSNRFDIMLTRKDGEQVDPDVVLFLVDFLFKVKAFHSLLRKVITILLPSDTYQVTDYCIGGLVEQDITSDVGQQQTPPETIIPLDPGDCPHYTPEEYGFRRWDITYRQRILADLKAEFDAWSAVEADCEANKNGQDRSIDSRSNETTLSDAVRADFDADRDTLCELDGSDYCYLGRPRDTTNYQMVLDSTELWRFKPCNLGLGYGVYYTYPGTEFLDNRILEPYIESSGYKPKFLSWLGDKYRAYSRTDANSLHYSDYYGLDASDAAYNWLAITRRSLDIQKDNLNFPAHRFPSMGSLLDDFTHLTWKLKPWDVPIDCGCNNPVYANPLNASIELDSSGNEQLVFDDMPYSLSGNGLLPDIYSLGEHRIGSETNIDSADDVSHAIYADIAGGHPAISQDGVVQSIGVTAVTEAKFGSAAACGSEIHDFSDGYVADFGWLSGTGVDVNYFPASVDPTALANALDIPAMATDEQLLFTLISQIAVDQSSPSYDFYRPVRLDCDCLQLTCTGTALEINPDIRTCTAAEFISTYGSADNDQVEYDQYLLLSESVDVQLYGVDNPLSSLFYLKQSLTASGWVVDENGAAGPTFWPENGSFSYKDSYDTIYEVSWETIGQYLDVVQTTKEPRVWGESTKNGQLINREIYYTGTVTTTRQIFLFGDGGWLLVAEASEQGIESFQATYLCNAPFIDPFIHNLNNNIQDTFGHAVTCGSHWTDPSIETSENVVWTGISGPGSGLQPLMWVDIFGAQDITAVCG